MRRIRVAVIAGGSSSERKISLLSGRQVTAHLPRSKYAVWLVNYDGKLGSLRTLRGTFDVAFIALHGKNGEDGKIQAALKRLGIPYTGSGVRASELGMDKARTLKFVSRHGIRTPKRVALTRMPKGTAFVLRRVGLPCVVKPNASGSSVGISIVRKLTELTPAIRKAFQEDSTVLVEQYIRGRELTCGVVGNTGQPLRALPLVEIIPVGSLFFDYRAKYRTGGAKEICPARVGPKVATQVQEYSRRIHRLLGCDGVTRSDFILTPSGALYFLEINTIPGLTERSLVPKEAKAAGMSFSNFLDVQVKLALKRQK